MSLLQSEAAPPRPDMETEDPITRLVNNLGDLLEEDKHLRQCQLKKLEDEKRATEERMNAIIEKLQQENCELKEELSQLKEEHVETHSSLKKSQDVASRDAALERNLVLLAQGVLNLKVSTEKKFKKLGKKVEQSAGERKDVELQEELARKLEEKDEEIEKLKNKVACLEAQVTKHTVDGKEYHDANLLLELKMRHEVRKCQRELDEAKFEHAREIQKLKVKLEALEKNEQPEDEQSEDEQSSMIELNEHLAAMDNMVEDLQELQKEMHIPVI